MAIYLNPANNEYIETKNGQIFVDKSLLIEYTNKVINTNMQCLCFKTKTLWKEYRCKYASCILF